MIEQTTLILMLVSYIGGLITAIVLLNRRSPF